MASSPAKETPVSLEKKAEPVTPTLSTTEGLKLYLYRRMPDRIIPGDLRGKLIINNYLSRPAGKKKKGLAYFDRAILSTPGSTRSLVEYLNGAGKDKVPELVERELGKSWYTGPAKLLAKTPFGRDFVINKLVDRTIPRIGGSQDLSRQFLAAGGNV